MEGNSSSRFKSGETAMECSQTFPFVKPQAKWEMSRENSQLFYSVAAALLLALVFRGFRQFCLDGRGYPGSELHLPDPMLCGLSPKQFMAVPIISFVIFGVLLAIGVWKRRQPNLHRPMMLLAVLTVMPAAVNRIAAFNALYSGTVWNTIFGPFFLPLIIGLFLLLLNWALTHSLDRWLAIGYAGLVVASLLIMRVATTSAWGEIASFMLQ
jgi:hypothetical protein